MALRPGLTTGLPLSEEFALHASQDPGHGRIVIFQALISLAPANWSLSGHVMDPSHSFNRSLPVSEALPHDSEDRGQAGNRGSSQLQVLWGRSAVFGLAGRRLPIAR